MSKTQTPPVTFAWQTLPVADLTARNPIGEASPELVAEITAHGVYDPIYVHPAENGYEIQDSASYDRLAAAAAAGLETVPVTLRPVMRIEAVAVHPKNARVEYHLSPEFIASLAADGCRVSVGLQRLADGTPMLADGHRRYYGSKAAGLTHLPYYWDERTRAEQHLDMVTTAEHAAGLNQFEQAGALFEASEAGADVKTIARVAGVTQKEARKRIKVGGSAAVGSIQSAAPQEQWSMEDYATMQELEAIDPEAVARVTAALSSSNQRWSARMMLFREVRASKARQAAAAHRAKLEKDGARIVPLGELSDRARPLYLLAEVTNDHQHKKCQGHVYVLAAEDDEKYTAYCANPLLYGHITQAEADGKKSTSTNLRAVKAGNLDWDAAEDLRRQHLREFIQRTGHKKAEIDKINRAVVAAMYTERRSVLADQMHKTPTITILADLLGMPEDSDDEQVKKKTDKAAAARLPVLALARLTACHESRMTRQVWRTDNAEATETRRNGRDYLIMLCDVTGYEPTPIEAAVIANEPYAPEGTEPIA